MESGSGTHSWGCVEPSPRALFFCTPRTNGPFHLTLSLSSFPETTRTLGSSQEQESQARESREQLCAAAGLIPINKSHLGICCAGQVWGDWFRLWVARALLEAPWGGAQGKNVFAFLGYQP